MERLVGVLGDGPLYSIDRVDDYGELADVELAFDEVAAHPYEALVRATVEVVAQVPGVLNVWHEDREVVLVRAPRVALDQLAAVIDRFWLEALAHMTPDPAYGDVFPAHARDRDWKPASVVAENRGSGLREAFQLPPSRRRMWTYLGFGAVVTLGGLAVVLGPGRSSGVVALVLGIMNLAVGVRIAMRRRGLAR